MKTKNIYLHLLLTFFVCCFAAGVSNVSAAGPISVQFIGTCAADNNCESYGRRLSSALVNKDLLVDFSRLSTATYLYGVPRLQQLGIDINSINSVLITHDHGDHLMPSVVADLARARTSGIRLTLYGGVAVVNDMNNYLASTGNSGLVNVVHLNPYVESAVGPYTVIPLIANHDVPGNEPYVYIIRYNGEQFLYGTDSGTLNGTSLEKIYATKFDFVIRERTFAVSDPDPAGSGHMDKNKVAAERADWIAHGVITASTPYLLTHIAFCGVGSCSVPAGTQDLGDGAVFPVNYAPKGSFDYASCSGLSGWACDQDDYSKALDVHFYVDGPAGSGTYLNMATGSNAREAAVGSLCGGNANHGFSISFPTPDIFKDGKPHTIYAQAINTPSGSNPLISNNPKTVQCPAVCTNQCPANGAKQCSGNGVQTCAVPANVLNGCLAWGAAAACPSGQSCLGGNCAVNSDPKGFFDGASCSGFSGWACDANDYAQPIAIHFYADGTAGTGTFAGAITANTVREPAVGAQCGGNVNHGFYFTTPDSLKDGRSHTINAYAINTPAGNNPLLTNNPKSVQCAAAACTNECQTNGAKQCLANGVQTCALSGGCLNWGTAVACASGQTCAGGACAATPGTANGAQFIRQSVLSPMVSGQSYQVSVTVKNTGDTAWTGAGNYRLGSQNPQDNTIWGNGRQNLAAGDSVAAGQNKTFVFNVTAPGTPGTYNFQWQMLREAAGWFGDKTANVAVTVVAPAIACVPKTCASLGDYICGAWPDGCNNTLNCGACGADKVCSNGECLADCTTHASKKCADSDLYWYNSCGAKEGLAESCGSDAPASETRCFGNWLQIRIVKKGCSDNACGSESAWTNDTDCAAGGKMCFNGTCASSNCVPKTCSSLRYECGSASDGCGKTLNCGGCGSGSVCREGVCVAGPSANKPANQMTAAELTAKVNELRTLIARLQDQLKLMLGSEVTKYSCARINKYLNYGVKNEPEVKCLQEFLKAQGYAVVPTGNYGIVTKQAIKEFQEKYASEILAPYGLRSGSGNVGNSTRAKINSLFAE